MKKMNAFKKNAFLQHQANHSTTTAPEMQSSVSNNGTYQGMKLVVN